MSSTWLARGAVIGGICLGAVIAGGGMASAAYLSFGGGVTALSRSTATFSGGGFADSSPVTFSVTYCGTTHTATATSGADGSFSLTSIGAETTTYAATGSNSNGSQQTVSTSAVLAASCADIGQAEAAAVLAPGAGGSGGGGLPFTGFEVGAFATVGLVAVGAGTFAIVGSRRRRHSPSTS